MSRTVRKIGIVLETKEDALRVGRPLGELYHWREPEEIEALMDALSRLGFEPRLLGTPAAVAQQLARVTSEIDFIFNVSVGFVSRNRMALGPALYELGGIPHSGADPFGKLCTQNKQVFYAMCERAGIPVPAWQLCERPAEIERLDWRLFPAIVKPAWEGASIGIGADAVVADLPALRAQAHRLLQQLGIPVIVQSFVRGRELKVGRLGDEPTLFEGIIEDIGADGSPMGDRFLYFDAKKTGGLDKRPLDGSLWPELLADCRRLYGMFRPLDYATFDVRVDDQGRHSFLELNADATLHPRRTLAECCRLHGVSYEGLIDGILRSAFARQELTRP